MFAEETNAPSLASIFVSQVTLSQISITKPTRARRYKLYWLTRPGLPLLRVPPTVLATDIGS